MVQEGVRLWLVGVEKGMFSGQRVCSGTRVWVWIGGGWGQNIEDIGLIMSVDGVRGFGLTDSLHPLPLLQQD